MPAYETTQTGAVFTAHDPELLPQAGPWLFDPQALQQRGLIERATQGRRSAFVFRLGGHGFVLRHFWRGGLVGRVLTDTYLWTGLSRSRPLREWQLLQALSGEELPVPRPAALRVVRHGLIYRADLITERLPASQTLADHLERAPLDAAAWRRIGETIGSLHRRGAYHADLNARNILLSDDTHTAYLIDWDRGRLRRPSADWQQANLERLRRSLNKLSGRLNSFHFRPQDLDQLLAGYRAGGGDAPGSGR